jgi:16S rRNA (adenine1518-N6/adenine1519-N6)-dimethyltransferase
VAAEQFDVVNERDEVVGIDNRKTVHAEGKRHRAVHILVFNPKGDEVFLQKRSQWKDQFPGKWVSSASGHVGVGESYSDAVVRELKEELGIAEEVAREASFLTKLPATERNGWEFIGVYQLKSDGPFRWPAAEIEWGGFFPVTTVDAWLESRPDDFPPGFVVCWTAWKQSICERTE